MLTPYPFSPPPTPEEIQRQLPERLAAALERRWYENFEPYVQAIAPHAGGDVQAETRVLEILEVKHGPDKARSLHLLNMQNVLSSLRDGSHSLLYSVSSNGQKIKLHMGVRHFQDRALPLSTHDYVDVLSRALRSNYPGIVLSPTAIPHEEYDEALLYPLENSRYLAGITGIPSLKQDMNSAFAQSIDRFVDALRGESYNLLVLAEPVRDDQLNDILFRLRRLSEEIHLLVNQTISKTRGETRTEGQSTGTSTGVTIGFGGLSSMLFGPSINRTMSKGTSSQSGISESGTLTQDALNKTAQFCEQMLDHYLTRIQRARNLGFWNVGVYIATESQNTFLRTQGIARSLYAGQHTHFEPLRILDLSYADAARHALTHLRNPYLETGGHEIHPLGKEFHSLGTPLTTEELSTLVSLPNQDVPGLNLRPVADFSPNPPLGGDLELGQVIYRGEVLSNSPIAIETETLAKHTFISGITGGGKTNTCMIMLKAAVEKGKPFLVIEPAKTEYRSLLADSSLNPPLHIFTLGNENGAPFRLNPFEFELGFNLLTHIDLLKAVFNAAFPMYASMPYILEEAILKVYQDRGWDVARSVNQHLLHDSQADHRDYLPTLADLYETVEGVVLSKGYDVRLTHDLTAALKARLQSLRLGGKGMMLDTQRSISFHTLLSRPIVLELQEIGDDDEKAFVMALLLIRLYEYCRQNRQEAQGQLQHLTLIEEAHRLLKNIPTQVSAESGNPRGKAVEMFTDILAEIREYGEGFVIVDQIPSKLVPDVVKNTNLKIIHRLVADDDRTFVGNAIGLDADQKAHLVRMRPGEAVIHNQETYSPLLVQIKPANKDALKAVLRRDEQALILQSAVIFRQYAGEDYRRWPGCFHCPTPCTFLSGSNQPGAREAHLFRAFLGALLYGTSQAVWERWQSLYTEIDASLRPRYAPTFWTQHNKGILFCAFVQHTRLSTALFYSYYQYQARGAFRSLIEVERQVMVAILFLLEKHPMTLPNKLLVAVQQTFREQMAQTPATTRPGCRACQRQCHFGILVQLHPGLQKDAHPQLAQTLVKIMNAPPDTELRGQLTHYKKTARAVVDFAQQQTQETAPLPKEELPHLAYCFLTNVFDNAQMLENFQQAIQKEIL